jgi:hypothetical protein
MHSGIALQLIGTALTVAALLWGVWTYKRNGEAQIQLLALESTSTSRSSIPIWQAEMRASLSMCGMHGSPHCH